MKKGYKLLLRIVGEAILGQDLNRKERTVARHLYASLKGGETIGPEWDGPEIFEKIPSVPSLFRTEKPEEIRKTVVAPAAAAKGLARQRTVDHAKDSAGYHGENPLED
jgi:hypothetical protein